MLKGSKKHLGSEKLQLEKKFWFKIKVTKSWLNQTFWTQNKFGFKNFILKELGSKNKFELKNVGSKNVRDQKQDVVPNKLRPKNICSKQFGKKWISKSWDIASMDKCHQDKCCLDKCHHNSWHLLNMVPGTYL